MRRLAPWVLVVLLGLGAGLGAALGAAASPGTPGPTPAQWVDGVLATTKAAGTARLAFSSVTASKNPDLRGSSSGTGAIDFSARTMRTTEVQHQIEWSIGPGGVIDPRPETLSEDAIAIGPTLYQSLAPVGLGFGLHFGWTKLSFPRPSALGLASGAPSALIPLAGPYTVLSARELGPATLDGTATTRYLVRSELEPACPHPRGKSHVAPLPSPTSAFTTVWIDGKGRLMQARSSSYDSGRIPAALLKATPQFADRPKGSSTTTSTLRFSAFGTPLHISPPAATEGGGGTSIALTLRCASS